MKQPWIHTARTDGWFILSPPFFVLLIVFVFQQQLIELQTEYSFYTWLFLIVFIDVAHVYSTLFKTYFIKKEFQRRKKLYIIIPILSLAFGIIFYQLGTLFFWSALALVAVFHFVRQQYGFMRLYSRYEPVGISKTIDSVAIYAATIFPMLYWFHTPRNFTWFIANEFDWLQNFPNILPLYKILYVLIVFVFIIKTIWEYFRKKTFNIPKNILILGTFLSWFFGIVYFNNDVIFTLLNVVSHGIPYIALIYISEFSKKEQNQSKINSVYKNSVGMLLFLGIIIILAFSEEFFWEVLVWKENIVIEQISISKTTQMFLVPLLTVPQLTHYLLDGFIWKRNH